jgi:glucose dehydrogenase
MPGIQNSIVVTESGLVFGAGRDNFIRAWDSDTGKQLWSSRFGGDFTGSPAMYEMGGTQYLLVPAAGARASGRGAGAAPASATQDSASAPLGWVAYTLAAK